MAELTDEQVRDGLALADALKQEKYRDALARRLAKLNDDAIQRWMNNTGDGPYTKKWIKGYRDCLAEFEQAFMGLAEHAVAQEEMAKKAEAAIRSTPDGGLGTGDLAIS